MKISSKLKLVLKSVLSLQMGETKTDKAVLIWDGEGDLKEGDEVFVRGGDPEDNAELQPASDGEYRTEDGKVIVVEGGIVTSISDPEAEVAPVEEKVEETEETPEETPLADDPEKDTTEEVSVEDRVAALEEKLTAIIEGLNEIVNGIANLEQRMGEVEGKLAKVEAPAADPIDDSTDVQESKHKSILSYLKKQ